MSVAPAVIVLGPSGLETARRARAALPGAELHGLAKRVNAADVLFDDTAEHLGALFLAGRPIIALAAAGIVIRCLAPHLSDKTQEPPVIALAEDGSHAVPLLGGHHGANRMAEELAAALSGRAAITTAGELALGFAFDDPPEGWRLQAGGEVKKVTAALLAGEAVALDDPSQLADWLHDSQAEFNTDSASKVAVSVLAKSSADITLSPQILALGVGCERGVAADEVETAQRRARHQAVTPADQAARVYHVQPVDVLVGIDRADNRQFVEMTGKRQLYQNAIGGLVAIKAPHQVKQILLRCLRRQNVFEGFHPGGTHRLALVADVDGARRVVADQHNGEPRREPMLRFQRLDFARDAGAQLRGDGLAVDAHSFRHERIPSRFATAGFRPAPRHRNALSCDAIARPRPAQDARAQPSIPAPAGATMPRSLCRSRVVR